MIGLLFLIHASYGQMENVERMSPEKMIEVGIAQFKQYQLIINSHKTDTVLIYEIKHDTETQKVEQLFYSKLGDTTSLCIFSYTNINAITDSCIHFKNDVSGFQINFPFNIQKEVIEYNELGGVQKKTIKYRGSRGKKIIEFIYKKGTGILERKTVKKNGEKLNYLFDYQFVS